MLDVGKSVWLANFDRNSKILTAVRRPTTNERAAEGDTIKVQADLLDSSKLRHLRFSRGVKTVQN